MTLTDAAFTDSERKRGIRAVLPGDGQQQIPVATARHLPPQVSEWLPELLTDLLPATTTALRCLAHEYDDTHGTNIVETRRPGPFVYDYLIDELGCDALATHYASALTDYALKYSQEDYDTLPERHQATHDQLEHWLTQFGTGAGPFDRGIDALDRGPLAIHRHAPRPQTLVISFDATAWRNVSDRRTAATSLSALAALGEAFDVALVVTSPRLLRDLRRHHREWVDEHLGALDFSERGIPTRTEQASTGEEMDARTTAIAGLTDLDKQGGRVRLLAALPTDGYREQRTLIDDPDVDLAESTVSNYLGDLAALDLITVDSEGRLHNSVRLTSAGKIAQEYIADDYTVRSPQQATLDASFSPTPHGSTSRVYRAQQARKGGNSPSPTTAEEWLADTGTADEDGYVAWLGGPTDVLDSFGMHERHLAARRTPGVTLVDHDIAAFDDGRVAYLSCFDDHVQAFVQWGGPLPTLARCTATLLSERAFSRYLTPEALGDEFQDLYTEFKDDVTQILVQGAQIGWFGEDEHEYEGFKERYRAVRNFCLERLPQILGSDKPTEYGDLFRNLHGLFASATQLYHAAGMDVTIQLRVPDTAQLQRNQDRYRSFLDFFGHTGPMHTVYESTVGVHSGYREVLEDREGKLASRLDYDLDVNAPHAECTLSWVVSGPGATAFESDIHDAIQSRAGAIREEVRDGDENAPLLTIPVLKGTSYPAITAVIKRIAGRKGYLTEIAELLDQGVRARRPLERCRRLLIACLSAPDRTGEVSPFDVAEALLHCAQTKRVEPLSVDDVAFGLAHLPTDRLLPTLAPTATKIVQVLLLADEPLGMTEILDRASVSESSYNRHIGELATLAIVEPHTVEGRRRWTAHLEPWWAPESPATAPHGDEPSLFEGWTPYLRDILAHITETTDPALSDELLDWPPDVAAVLEQAVGAEPWLMFLAAQFGVGDPSEITGNERGETSIAPGEAPEPPTSADRPDVTSPAGSSRAGQRTAVIGVEPKTPATTQTTLSGGPADD